MTMFDPDISKGTRILQAFGGFAVLAILAGVIFYLGSGWSNAANDARSAQNDYRKQVVKTETLQQEYNKLYSEFQNATGKKPQAATPQSIRGATGAQGPAGAAGAVGERGLRGDMGIPGQTGPQGIPGASGRDGVDGKNGIDGQSGPQGIPGQKGDKGDPGDPGAPSTVPGPVGPQGPQGQKGDPGPGRGIQSIDCQGVDATSSWVITYTDGSTQQIAGPCRTTITQ